MVVHLQPDPPSTLPRSNQACLPLQLQKAQVRLQVPADDLGDHRLLQRGVVHPAEDGSQRAGDVAGHPAEGGGAGG